MKTNDYKWKSSLLITVNYAIKKKKNTCKVGRDYTVIQE